MGHTNYWKIKNPISEIRFQGMLDEIAQLTGGSGIPLGDMDGLSSPRFESNEFAFNGAGKASYETFVFRNERTEFSFCKTEHRPYDAVVCAALILAKAWFKEDIEISSDGSWKEWQPGRDMFERIFGETDLVNNSVLERDKQPA